jgi:tyrosyl-tRNA synthetase
MIKQGGLKINGEKYGDENIVLEADMVLQVGKRKFIRIIL